jgi:hypothetical protein
MSTSPLKLYQSFNFAEVPFLSCEDRFGITQHKNLSFVGPGTYEKYSNEPFKIKQKRLS